MKLLPFTEAGAARLRRPSVNLTLVLLSVLPAMLGLQLLHADEAEAKITAQVGSVTFDSGLTTAVSNIKLRYDYAKNEIEPAKDASPERDVIYVYTSRVAKVKIAPPLTHHIFPPILNRITPQVLNVEFDATLAAGVSNVELEALKFYCAKNEYKIGYQPAKKASPEDGVVFIYTSRPVKIIVVPPPANQK
jgi:hypothetical protein